DVSIEDGMSNEDLVMRRFISDYVYDWDYKKRYGRKKWRRAKTISAKSWSEDTGEALFATVYANGDIYLKGESIDNRGTPEALAPVGLDERQQALVPAKLDVTLHDGVQSGAIISEDDIADLIGNALFSVNTDPDHPYLIES